jgi:hypothetical protein
MVILFGTVYVFPLQFPSHTILFTATSNSMHWRTVSLFPLLMNEYLKVGHDCFFPHPFQCWVNWRKRREKKIQANVQEKGDKKRE